MAEKVQEHIIRSFGTASSLKDSTEAEPRISLAKNIRGRPLGAICGPPLYARLAQIGNSQFVDATYFALTYTPFGGSPRALVRASDKTIAIDVSSQGLHWLLFYSLNTRKCRGLFYMGDDGTFNGTPNLVTSTATMQVLAVGLDDNARWYGKMYYDTIHLGNGVDANAVVQLARTALAPGKWRTAASNQKPAAAVLRQVVPTASDQVQATWTIPGTNRNNFDANIFFTVTANTTTDTFTKVSTTASPALTHGLSVGDPVWINPGGLGGVSAATVYYVIASGLTLNNFKVSATLGGSTVNLTGAGTNIGVQPIGKVYAPGHTFKAGDAVTLTTEVQLPDFLPTGNVIDTTTTYYVVNPAADQLGLAPTAIGSAIEINTAGVGVSQIVAVPVSGHRLGKADLTFTADKRNFPGSIGNNIYVSITYSSGGASPDSTAISSTLAGSGTVSDPYHYALFVVPGSSSTQAIVDFVNGDSNATGILAASATTTDATEDTQSWAFHELTGGQDSTTVNGVAVGFRDKTCTMYLRYWDVGVNYLGYEGVSSDLSNAVVIDALSNYLIEASITPNPSVEGGRFGFIRAYLQFGEDVEAQWNLVAEVPNGSSSAITVPPTVSTSQPAIHSSTWRFDNTSSKFANGEAIRFSVTSPGTLPTLISASTTYYVVNASISFYNVSTTLGGSPIVVASGGSGSRLQYRKVQQLLVTGTPFTEGSVIHFTTTGTLPSGLTAGTNYYVSNPVDGSFGIALTQGGSLVSVLTPGTGTHTASLAKITITVGVETPVGQPMMVDQNRPLPSTLVEISGGNVWHAGCAEFPMRLYPSKQANETELYPEGANLLSYEIVRFPASESGQRVTALYSDDQNLYVHSPGGICYFPPATPDNKTFPRVFSGAVTDSALGVWTQNRLNYLGADLNIYQQVQSNINPLQSDFMALDAAAYVKSFTDLNAFTENPDRVFVVSDVPGQALWLWVPGTDGNLVGFCYDRLQKGIVGPFSSPKVYAMTKLEVGRPEFIFSDESGNLFVWDTSKQYDWDTPLPSGSTPAIHTLGSGASAPSEQGFEQTPVPGGEYWRSSTMSMETGFLDMGKPGVRKAFIAALITSVKNSRALITVTFTTKSGRTVSISYGDIYSKGVFNIHKCLMNSSDTAVKVRIDLVTAEMAPVQIRDLTVQWRALGQL